MSLRGNLREDLGDLPFFIDHEGGAFNAHHLVAVHVLFFKDAVGVHRLFIRIGKQGVGQIVLFFELLLFLDRVRGDAEDGGAGFLDRLECVAEPARLYGSTRGVSLGKEEQHHVLAFVVF